MMTITCPKIFQKFQLEGVKIVFCTKVSCAVSDSQRLALVFLHILPLSLLLYPAFSGAPLTSPKWNSRTNGGKEGMVAAEIRVIHKGILMQTAESQERNWDTL